MCLSLNISDPLETTCDNMIFAEKNFTIKNLQLLSYINERDDYNFNFSDYGIEITAKYNANQVINQPISYYFINNKNLRYSDIIYFSGNGLGMHIKYNFIDFPQAITENQNISLLVFTRFDNIQLKGEGDLIVNKFTIPNPKVLQKYLILKNFDIDINVYMRRYKRIYRKLVKICL